MKMKKVVFFLLCFVTTTAAYAGSLEQTLQLGKSVQAALPPLASPQHDSILENEKERMQSLRIIHQLTEEAAANTVERNEWKNPFAQFRANATAYGSSR